MEMLVWHMMNCETEAEWEADLQQIRETGFDGVVTWSIIPAEGGWWDVRDIVRNAEKTLRLLDALHKEGLYAYLGVWNPHCMGAIPLKYQVMDPEGKREERANIFNIEWIDDFWVPYIASLAKAFADHPAYRGLYFDDTFCWQIHTFYSYTESDVLRFREFIKRKYVTYENYKQKYRLDQVPDSFDEIMPPTSPAVSPKIWMDWMEARAEWCEEFAKTTVETYRAIDGDKQHLLILGDNEFFYERSSMSFGVDFARVMKYFDRLELYMAEEHQQLADEEMARNVTMNIEEGLRVSGGKSYGLATWWTSVSGLVPMRMSMLRKMWIAALESGADAFALYTYKVHDWALTGDSRGQLIDGRVPKTEISLKFHPEVLQEIKAIIEEVRNMKMTK